MKKKIFEGFGVFILIIQLFVGKSHASQTIPDPHGQSFEEMLTHVISGYKKQNLDEIVQAKKYLISGDIERAKFLLERFHNEKSVLSAIRQYYLSIIHFIEEDYAKGLAILEGQQIYRLGHTKDICYLKLLYYFALNKVEKIKRTYLICNESTQHYSTNMQLWAQSMVEYKLQNETTFFTKKIDSSQIGSYDYILSNNQLLRIWLKFILFSNQEEKIADILPYISLQAFQSKKIREIMAFMYYRVGNQTQALELLDGIHTTNSEVIKGNILYKSGAYTSALVHFNNALKRKPNSMNALERAIPIHFHLEQWKEAENLIKRFELRTLTQRDKLTLDTLFKIRLNNLLQAKTQLVQLDTLFQFNSPYPLVLMNSFVATMTGDKERMNKYSTLACRNYDGVNCWSKMQQFIWEDLHQVLKNDDPTYNDRSLTMATLKESPVSTPLEEEVLIEQKNVEELDDKMLISPVKFKYLGFVDID